MTYAQAFKNATEYLAERGVADASVDAWYLMEFCCGISRAEYLLRKTEEMPQDCLEEYQSLLAKRGERIPLQHLTGEQEFMGFSFRVSDQVLVPRQDTEVLVEEALRRLKCGRRVLDLCTGSGCIAISIGKLRKDAAVTASDLSEEALSVARDNAERLEADISFRQSDLFEQLPDAYDMIVSNPPYIPTRTIDDLAEEVRLHDPRMALDGGADGLVFYRKIIKESAPHLERGGWLLFEIGWEQADAVSEMMRENGFAEVRVIKDLAGLDRVVEGRRV